MMISEKFDKFMNKDGLNSEIYLLLWTRQPHNENFSFPFLLPHTVIFKQGIPYGWFYSNGTGNFIKRKEKNINIKNLVEIFTSKKSLSSIAASFYYQKQEKPDNLYVKYVTHDEIYKFINDEGGHKENGILQQFIDPQHEHNTIIQATWSPNICIFQKYENKKKLYDFKFDLHERAVTAEGSEAYVSVQILKSPYIANKLSFGLDQIRFHIHMMSFEKCEVTRMCAYFKVDKNQNIYFLYLNSIRSKDDQQIRKKYEKEFYQKYFEEKQYKNVPINMIKPKFEQQNHKNIKTMYTGPAEITKSRCCFRCNQLKCNVDMIDCPLLFIISAYDKENDQYKKQSLIQKIASTEILLAGRDRKLPLRNMFTSLKIPQEFHKLYPKLTQNLYDQQKNTPDLAVKNVQICQDCYLYLIKFEIIISGVQPQPLVQEFQHKYIENKNEPVNIQYKRLILPINSIIKNNQAQRLLKQQKKKYNNFKNPKLKFDTVPTSPSNLQKKFSQIELDYCRFIKGAESERQEEKNIYSKDQFKQNQTNYLSSTNCSPTASSLQQRRQKSMCSQRHQKSMGSFSFKNSINIDQLNSIIQEKKSIKAPYI